MPRAPRIDYKKLATTGQKIPKTEIDQLEVLVGNMSLQEDINSDASSKDLNQLLRQEKNIKRKLNFFFQEYDLEDDDYALDDLKDAVTEVKEIRNHLDRIHQLLEEIDPDYEKNFEKEYTMGVDSIMRFIKEVNKKKDIIKKEEMRKIRSQADAVQRRMKVKFCEIERQIEELLEIFTTDISSVGNKDLQRLRSDVSKHSKTISRIGTNIEEIIVSVADDVQAEEKISELQNRYERIISLSHKYSRIVKDESEKREIDKLETFQSSSLKIELPKFKGYGSQMDFYTFKSTFEKVHNESVPKFHLPEFLKNNFLDNPALNLVKNVTEIDEIWKRLQENYGNPKVMLTKKLTELSKIEGLWKLKDSVKVVEGIAKITNLMRDLMKLSQEHNIENQLYYGDAFDRICKLLGEKRLMRWITVKCESTWEGKKLWEEFIKFLDKDQKVSQHRALLGTTQGDKKNTGNKDFGTRNYFSNDPPNDPIVQPPECFFCGETGHVKTNGPNGSKLCQYFSCKQFAEASPAARYEGLRKKGFCCQCLYPGAKWVGKHRSGQCQRDYVCPNASHNKYTTKLHVLICEEHKDNQENKELLQKYKERFILKHSNILPDYSKEIKLSYTSTNESKGFAGNSKESVGESAIFMLQTVKVDNNKFTIFYDTGCKDFLCRFESVQTLGNRANQEFDGQIGVRGVGGIGTNSPHGIYSVKLPLTSGKDAIFVGSCLERLTEDFPNYPLEGAVERDIRNSYFKKFGNYKNLPALPSSVGGQIDFMIGIKYLRHYPVLIFELPSGLSIYKSRFENHDGSLGVIGGPHRIFSEIEKMCHVSKTFFISNQLKLFQNGYQVNPDVSFLGYKDFDNFHDICEPASTSCVNSRKIKLFEKAEEAGSEINYRCIQCRDCKRCKSHQDDEAMSIKEECEQELIEKSISIDTENKITIARLPIMSDPKVKLCPNKEIAEKVLGQQLNKLSKSEEDKIAILKSEEKLQKLGFVDFVSNLPENVQKDLELNDVQNFLPWRASWKENSLSTPCRLVFDASQPTKTGYALNDILPKGRNNMNKLVEIFIRWRFQKFAFHTDISKMYNSVQLHPQDWCYQRYLWRRELSLSNPIEEKVIKTLIYGVKSSGNQAEHSLREIARLSKAEFPDVFEIIKNDIYVDDCLSGDMTNELAAERADQLELVLSRGGFTLKGICMSGSSPSPELSSDQKTLNVAGLIWEPEKDTIRLDIKEVNFARKVRGRKVRSIPDVPTKLTRRHCTSKVAEIFDITGLLTPLVATLKVDLHELVVQKFDWDDILPDSYRNLWVSHFEMIQEMKNIVFKRAVIPFDAVNTDIDILCFGDASKSLLCVAIYARFRKKGGGFSCQLIFARSRLIPDGMTQPRAELYAALVNTHSSEIVSRSLYRFHHSSLKFTDSQIVLYWLKNDSKVLKQWVRNRVIEIHRFTSLSDWRFVASDNMIADLGTRRNVTLENVNSNSEWVNGFEWMRLDISQFPSFTVDEITISKNQLEEVRKECTIDVVGELSYHSTISAEVGSRYAYSNYLLDPNKFRFRTVVRVIAIVLRFVNALKRKVNPCFSNEGSSASLEAVNFVLHDDDIKRGQNYYFRKATAEIKNFSKSKSYEKFSFEKDGILFYTGRILEDNEFTIVGRMTSAMRDLTSVSFCVPLIDKFSPLAYSIINEIHWYSSISHSGVEVTLREILKSAYIIEGRELVKKFKADCERCRYLFKMKVAVAMGPVPPTSFAIAPCFYHSQVDIAGPYNAFTFHNKRKSIKIWLAVFCCCTTSATHINVMEDYSSSSFIQSFVRFSCYFGYPKSLISDEGSQIVKSFKSMELNYRDIKQKLHTRVAVEYNVVPVGGHNMSGKVERTIREIKRSIDKIVENNRYSVIQWETICSEISNTVNNLPLALGSIVSDFDSMDLLTPNRLILGRNNYRSPVSPLVLSSPDKLIESNRAIFESWFENWLVNHVPKLMITPKWFKSDYDMQKGDIVLFLKTDSALSCQYQYGIVESVFVSRDGRIRKVEIKYKNHNEGVFRLTYRAVREIIVIHRIDEVNMFTQLKQLHDAADAI